MNVNPLRPEEALVDTLSGAHVILAGLIRAIPGDRLNVRRKPHFWTIREHVAHLAEVQPMLTGRLERFRDEVEPNFTPYIPSDGPPPAEVASPPLSVDTALAQFASLRAAQVELIKSLPEAVWAKRGIHPEYEHYTPAILVRHIAMHDHWHMYRIEELWITRDEFLTEVS